MTNELFVANGFISADRANNYWYSMSKIAGANSRLFEDARSWPAFGDASLSGYQPSRVYLNRGLAGWVDLQLFVFFMITDPRTVVRGRRWQVGVAVVEALIRLASDQACSRRRSTRRPRFWL